MADNIPITPGSGKDVATDEITGTLEHAQIVKLAIATDGSRTLIPANGTDGLLVNLGTNNDVAVASIAAGDNNIGNVDVATVPAPLSTTGGGTEAAALRVTLATDSTGVVSVDDNGAALSVDWNGTTPVTGSGTATGALRVELPTNGTGVVGVTSVVPGTTTSALGKQEGEAHAAGNTGVLLLGVRNTSHTALTGVVQGDYAPINVDGEGCVVVVGNVAHDAQDADPPIKVGMKAIAHGANPTAVAAADRTDWYANRAGVPFVMGGHPNVVTSRTTYAAAAQTDVAIGPGTIATGTKIVVTQAQVTVSNATTATPSVIIGFGSANTPTGAGVVISHPGIPGGGGVSRGDGSGILGVGADGEELRITSAAATGGVMDVVVSYYTIES